MRSKLSMLLGKHSRGQRKNGVEKNSVLDQVVIDGGGAAEVS
jgi:hypothetical protein